MKLQFVLSLAAVNISVFAIAFNIGVSVGAGISKDEYREALDMQRERIMNLRERCVPLLQSSG